MADSAGKGKTSEAPAPPLKAWYLLELRTMNPTVELVLKHKKANMRKSESLMLEALKSAPHLNDKVHGCDKLEVHKKF